MIKVIAESISRLKFANVALEKAHEVSSFWTVEGNPTQVLHKEIFSPSSIKQLKQIDRTLFRQPRETLEGLVFHVTLQSAHVWRIKM